MMASVADPETANGAADSQTEEDVFQSRMKHDKFDWNSHWYPVAVAEELDKRVPHAVTILARELVVWWDRNGKKWQVFEDKCPHRLAPLSEGRIDEKGHLQCCYHGWSFAPCSGACTCIPQAPSDKLPVWESKRAAANVYPCVEQEGIIWFWPDTRPEFKDIAAKETPPSIPELNDPSFTGDLACRDLIYGYEQLTENLMDPAHLNFAHHGIQGNRKSARPLNFKLEIVDKSGFSGKNENGTVVFKAPCTFIYRQVFPSHQSKGADVKKKSVFVFICIPVTPGKSRLIRAFVRNFNNWSDVFRPKWYIHTKQMLVLDSDMYILHKAERNLELAGGEPWEKVCYVPTTSDAFVIGFRKWLRVYGGCAPDWADNHSGKLPPSLPREAVMDRYSSHVKHCSCCRTALKVFEVAEVSMQVLSVGLPAILGAAALKPTSGLRKWTVPLVCATVACPLVSRWLSNFVKKTYYFHDYNHALVK